MIDLPLAAELVLVLLLVATLDTQPDTQTSPPADLAGSKEPEVQPVQPGEPVWSPQLDRHAQRILHLERCAARGTGNGGRKP
ncbi:hypothetical protein [Cyanobium sp. NIES-981]|uniref:hypothetical protein n=1 Tax=Cyanobium sp. NIES-981 TaxID=1851505 RepID=UPI0007DD1084|nr:hypothetical protein [Cyanobium sp. NIES-981]SBO42666.1 protein of unknown function [Cyanobium sp. NIES-981]